MRDDLGQQRVVAWAEDQPRPAVGIDAYARSGRRRECREGAGRRRNGPVGSESLRVDPGLNRDTPPCGELTDDFFTVRGNSGRQS